jgi:ribosomal protein S18 acetylase RimI-like enzyme
VEGTRPARPEDLPAIASLARAMRDELDPMKGGPLLLATDASPEPLEESFRGLLDRADALLVVGSIDDVVVGFGAVEIEALRTGERLGVIADLFVEGEARSVGIGEAMADAIVAFCREQQCVGVDARALPGHRATKNFFEEQGFTARAIVMHKPLRAEG